MALHYWVRTPGGLRLFRQKRNGDLVPAPPSSSDISLRTQNWFLALGTVATAAAIAVFVGPPAVTLFIFACIFLVGAAMAMVWRFFGIAGALAGLALIILGTIFAGIR